VQSGGLRLHRALVHAAPERVNDRISAGEIIANRYLLRKLLGRGGQASVWLAHDLESKSEIALKIASSRARSNVQSLDRLLREATLLRKLEHPHIARCLDFAIDAECPYISMEYVRGVSLAHEMRTRAQTHKTFSLGEVHEMFAQLLEAIGYAHGLGVVHRDLKPDNVMFVEASDGIRVKLLDLGVAKLLEQDHHAETTQGRVLGSVMYMSPEQAAGDRVDARADVFALGVILFEVLTLRRAWAQGEDGLPMPAFTRRIPRSPRNAPTEILSRILAVDRPKPSRWRANQPAELDTLVARATAVPYEVRIESAEVFAASLEAALGAGEPRTRLTVMADRKDGPLELEVDPSGDAVARDRPSDELAQARLQAVGPAYGATITGPGGGPSSEGPASMALAPGPALSRSPFDAPVRSRLPLIAALTLLLALGGVSAIIASSTQDTPLIIQAEPRALPVPRVEFAAPVVEAPGPAAEPPAEVEAEDPEPAPNPETPWQTSRVGESPKSKPLRIKSSRPAAAPSEGQRFPKVAAQLAALRRDPSNLTLLNETAQTIVEAAEGAVTSKPKLERIQRLATASMRVADVAQLERAFSELQASAD
jgi:serine/threonine protein kinase